MKQKKSTFLLHFLVLLMAVALAYLPFSAFAQEPVTSLDCKGGKYEVVDPTTGIASCQCPPGQSPDGDGNCQLKNPATGQLVELNNFPAIASRVIFILLNVAASVALVFLIIGGFQYVTSRGSEEGMEGAKRTLKGAIFGIVIILLSYAIIVIINNAIFSGTV